MNLDCNSNTNVGIKINSKFDGKSSNSSTAVDVKFSSRILRFHTVNKDSGSPVANIESSSVAVFRINTRSDCTQSDRNLFTPTDNDKLVIVNIFVTLIICKSTVWVNFDKQKLDNSKKKNWENWHPNVLTFHLSLSTCNPRLFAVLSKLQLKFFRYYRWPLFLIPWPNPSDIYNVGAIRAKHKDKKTRNNTFSYTPIAIVAY